MHSGRMYQKEIKKNEANEKYDKVSRHTRLSEAIEMSMGRSCATGRLHEWYPEKGKTTGIRSEKKILAQTTYASANENFVNKSKIDKNRE